MLHDHPSQMVDHRYLSTLIQCIGHLRALFFLLSLSISLAALLHVLLPIRLAIYSRCWCANASNILLCFFISSLVKAITLELIYCNKNKLWQQPINTFYFDGSCPFTPPRINAIQKRFSPIPSCVLFKRVLLHFFRVKCRMGSVRWEIYDIRKLDSQHQ